MDEVLEDREERLVFGGAGLFIELDPIAGPGFLIPNTHRPHEPASPDFGDFKVSCESESANVLFAVGVNSDAGLIGSIILDDRNDASSQFDLEAQQSASSYQSPFKNLLDQLGQIHEETIQFDGSGTGDRHETVLNERNFDLTRPATSIENTPTQGTPALFFREGVGLYRLQ
jgi:hypothetical protein